MPPQSCIHMPWDYEMSVCDASEDRRREAAGRCYGMP